MTASVQEEPAWPSSSSGRGAEDEACPSGEEADETDSDTPNKDEAEEEEEEEEEDGPACPSLKLDHRLQRTLFEFEDDDEAGADPLRSLTRNMANSGDSLCGWVPDPGVQYRRSSAAEKHPPARAGRTVACAVSSRGRPPLNCRGKYGGAQQHRAAGGNANAEYEFKHFGNYRRHSEQYRRFHTCGGPLQKLVARSAPGGQARTIYCAGGAAAEAGVVESGAGGDSRDPRSGQTAAGQTPRWPRPTMPEKPSPVGGQPAVSYSDISVNSPRFNLLSEPVPHHRRARHPGGVEWGWGTGETLHRREAQTGPGYGSQQRTSGTNGRPTQVARAQGHWTAARNEQTLTVHASQPPGSLRPSPAVGRPASPPKPHLPYFPTQQPLRQLSKTGSSLTPPGPSPPTDYLLPSGYSLDRSLGSPAGCSAGISRNPAPHRDFYSQLVHAAHCLSLAAKSPKDFDFQLPRWPTCTSHADISAGAQPQPTSQPEKPPGHATSSATSSTSSSSASMQVQMMGRRVRTSPTSTHQSLKSTLQPCKPHKKKRQQGQQKIRKSAPAYPAENPTSATENPTSATKNPTSATETHYITIEAPTCSPFDTRSARPVRRPSETAGEAGVSRAASYRVTLKEKALVPEIKEKASVDMVADSNRPLAVCEVTWF